MRGVLQLFRRGFVRPWTEPGQTAYRKRSWPYLGIVLAAALVILVDTTFDVSGAAVSLALAIFIANLVPIRTSSTSTFQISAPIEIGMLVVLTPPEFALGIVLGAGLQLIPIGRKAWRGAVLGAFSKCVHGATFLVVAQFTSTLPATAVMTLVQVALVFTAYCIADSLIFPAGGVLMAEGVRLRTMLVSVIPMIARETLIGIPIATLIAFAAAEVWWAVILVSAPIMIVSILARRERMLEATREELKDALEAARVDSLTGLYNRRVLEERATLDVIAEALDGSRLLSVVLVDVDHFKQINDTLGHAVGDDVLVRLADHLRACAPNGIALRIGGEEFMVVLPGAGIDAAMDVAERMRMTVRADEAEPRVTASFGVAGLGMARKLHVADGTDLFAETPAAALERMTVQADEALYAAKRSGRDRVCAWNAARGTIETAVAA